MNCEMSYCIYNEDCMCLLEKTNLNVLGMCEDCIIISLDRDFLKAEKERQRREVEKRWVENINK